MSTAVFGAPEFKTRSGRIVKPQPDGSIGFAGLNGYLGKSIVMDAEEYFQAKRDAELGRWRYPLAPDYVVYRDKARAGGLTDGTVVVIHEPSGDRAWMDPDGAYSVDGGTAPAITEAGRAYFKAFPFTRKPWQSARPGEVWVLTLPDEGDHDAEIVTVATTYGTFIADSLREWTLNAASILSARPVSTEDAS